LLPAWDYQAIKPSEHRDVLKSDRRSGFVLLPDNPRLEATVRIRSIVTSNILQVPDRYELCIKVCPDKTDTQKPPGPSRKRT
jgi:hypothetical protein